jgi:hypothetical protein
MKDYRQIPRSEALLDAAVEYTFPASDPISIDHAFSTARRRESPSADDAGEIDSEADRKRRKS